MYYYGQIGIEDKHISFDTNCLSQPDSLAAVSFKYFLVFIFSPLPQDTLHSLHSEYFVTLHSAKNSQIKKI